MRKISLLLSIVIIALSFCGCGGSGKDSSGGGSGAASGNADVIEIVSWWDETPVAGDELSDAMVKRQADIEKKYNVKFKFTVLPADEITSRFVTEVMSGGSLGDFVNMRHYWAFPEYAKKNFLLNMSDYLDFSDEAFNKDDTERATYDGNVYGFSMNPLRVGYTVYFNKAIFDKYGVAYPYDMYEKKTWTWDAVFDIAKKLTKTDSSGNTSVWGISPLGSYDVVELLVASHGGSFVEYVNGQAKSNLTSTATIRGLELARQATAVDKICDAHDSSAEWDYILNKFISGQYAMFISSSDVMDDLKKNMDDQYGIMPLPLGEGQNDYVNVIRERHFKVAASTADKDRMKKLLPIMYEYYKPFDNYDDIQKRNFETYTWDEESVNICNDLVKSQYVPEQYNFSTAYWDIVVVQGINKALSGEMTATAAMKAIDDAWQATISK